MLYPSSWLWPPACHITHVSTPHTLPHPYHHQIPQQGSTFGIPGVEQYAYFLRDVRHAEAIRAKLIQNIALAGVPGGCVSDRAC